MDSSLQRSFSFVNLKHPNDLKDEETQLRIRRLAMTEVAKARRKPKTKKARNDIVLELHTSNEQLLDFDRFGGGSIDPFSSYPVVLDDSARLLLANIFQSNSNHSTSLRGSWYPVGLSSATAFHNMLANSQNFIFQKLNGYFPSQDDALALTHHHKALRQVCEMLKIPHNHNSDEAIGAVVSFMCHQALLGSFKGGEWQKHQNALDKIISNRGGFDSIKTEYLRITLSWADLLSTFAQDIPPNVPLPAKWLVDSKSPPSSPRPLSLISFTWKQQLPMRTDWITIFDDIVQLISLDHAFSEEQLVLSITSGSWIEPTMWRLLTVRPLQHGSGRECVMEEVCRLGTLLFLAPLWRKLGHSPVWTAAISRNLLVVLVTHFIEWKELKQLLAWVVYFAAVETSDLAERSQFVFMLGIVMTGLQLKGWEELMQAVKDVLWVNRVCAGTEELIRDEVMAIVVRNAMHPVVVDAMPLFQEDHGSS